MTAIIRQAAVADATALLMLVQDCVAAMRALGIEQWDEVYPNADTIANDILAGTLEVLCEGDALLACMVVDRQLDPLWKDMDWTPGSEPAAAVHRLMVHPSQQGRGWARLLMQHAEQRAHAYGCRSIRLDSFLRNPSAMALYPKLGYRRTGTAMMRKGEFAGFEKLLYEA